VLQDLFTSCVCSNNLNRAVKTHLRALGRLAEGVPRSRYEFRLVFLRFSRGKLAPCNLIFHNETDWARSFHFSCK
jgi:hypothetical protein